MENKSDHPVAALQVPTAGFFPTGQLGISWPLTPPHLHIIWTSASSPRPSAHHPQGPGAGGFSLPIPWDYTGFSASQSREHPGGTALGPRVWGPRGTSGPQVRDSVGLTKRGQHGPYQSLGVPLIQPQPNLNTLSTQTSHRGTAPLPSRRASMRVGPQHGNPPVQPGSCPVPGTSVLVQRTKARRPLRSRERPNAVASRAC